MIGRLDLEKGETTKIHEQTRNEIHEQEEWDAAGFDAPVWLEDERGHSCPHERSEEVLPANDANERETMQDGECTAENQEIPHSEISIPNLQALELAYNAYHERIYVESRDAYTRRPVVWYQHFPEGTRRFQRGPFSIQVEHMKTKALLLTKEEYGFQPGGGFFLRDDERTTPSTEAAATPPS